MTRVPDLGEGRKRDKTLAIRVSHEEHERLVERAREEQRNVSNFVRELLVSVLKSERVE